MDIAQVQAPLEEDLKQEFLDVIDAKKGSRGGGQSIAALNQRSRDAWMEMLGNIQASLDPRGYGPIVIFFDALRQGIKDPANQVTLALKRGQRGDELRAPIPVLSHKDVERFEPLCRDFPWFCLGAIMLRLAGAIDVREIARKVGANDPAGLLSDPRMTAAIAEVQRFEDRTAANVDQALATIMARRSIIDEMSQRAEQISARIAAIQEAQADEWKTLVTNSKEEMDALKQQIADGLRLEASRSLWLVRAARHLWWMVGAFIALLAAVTAAVWIIVYFAIPHLEPTPVEIMTRSNFSTHKLALTIICIVGVAWVLRFVASSMIENKTLRADSQHRQSILETKLAVRGEVGLKDEERVIILTALFRPLPGQGPDENPPTVATELWQKLTNK